MTLMYSPFEAIAKARAQALLQDPRRVREAAEGRGSYQVTASLPVDVMGLYVLLPDASSAACSATRASRWSVRPPA